MIRRAAPLLALLLAGCFSPHAEGTGTAEGRGAPVTREATVAGPPPTIVSLNPCADAILARVAGPGQLLAISHYSHDPAATSMDLAEARRFRAVSGAVEEVMALRPQVVVASPFLAPATRSALEGAGLRVVTIGMASDVPESLAQVRELAALAGRPLAGDVLVARIEGALADAAPPPGWRPREALVWESGGIVAGDETLVADLLARTGFRNAAAARGLSQASYLSLETMIAHPPDVILTASDGRSDEDRLLSHPALRGLSGTTRAAFAPSLLWCGGPTIERAARRLKAVREGLGQGA